MRRTLMKSKIHRATVTEADLHYQGSIAIDAELLRVADILPHERVEIYNVTNGARFTTYIIRAEDGSGTISVNGAAARLAAKGDILIICTYGNFDDKEADAHKPKMVYINSADNSVSHTSFDIPVQVS